MKIDNKNIKENNTGASLFLDEKSAAKLADGMKEAKMAALREIFAKSKQITDMPAESVEKMAQLTAAVTANGGCIIGCC